MVSILELVIGAAAGIVTTIMVEEVISSIIRRAAKAAGTNPTVIRDVRVALRVITALVIT